MFKYISRLFFPPSCICCKKILDINDNSIFCDNCYEEIIMRKIDSFTEIDSLYIDKCYYQFRYRNWYVKKMISHCKYVSSQEFLSYIGKLAFESLIKHNLRNQLDIITFSPRRKSQIRSYGFDQAEEMAKAISIKTNIPHRRLLKRRGFSNPQKKLGAKSRKKNIIGKFYCTENLQGKRILLVDDVVTTGATVGECAKMLKLQGAKSVYVWTLAQ